MYERGLRFSQTPTQSELNQEECPLGQIKTLTETDYDAIFALSQFAFQYELSEPDLTKKKEEANRHIIWGWMVEQQLAAKLHLIPLSCYINGKEFPMGGISSVSTWPEYRRQGAVKNLLHHVLKHMRENGQTISFLHPFSFAFYRKYGWEHAFTEKSYTIPLEKLKRTWDGKGYVRRIQHDMPTLDKIYNEYTKQFNGPLVRDEKWWEQRVLKGDWHVAVSYKEWNEAVGYLIYNVKNEKLTIHEMAYSTLDGQKLLLQFISNHDSMADKVEMVVPDNDHLPLLLDEPRFNQKLEPYFMARIVDVFEFLKQYPFQLGNEQSTLTLHVEDSFLPENNGTYQLRQSGGETNVTFMQSNSSEDGIYSTIQYLTSMFIGYRRPLELYNLGLIQGKKEQIEQLERIIPNRQTFFPDFF